jgi:hypothetical protein
MKALSIVKQTATHADSLAAIGAADLLRHLDPHIVELEDRFEIRLSRDLQRSDVDTADPGFSYLVRSGKNQPAVPLERVTRLGSKVDDEGQTNFASGPAEDRMYVILSRMKAYAGPNEVVSLFAKLPAAEWTRRIWDCLQGGRRFTRARALVQLFNPQSARGYASLKPGCTDRSDKSKDAWAEPFLEWLRYRGYFEGCAGWFTDGDLRLYCPIPAGVSHNELASAAASFRSLRLGGTAAKIDCRAVLGFTRLLIQGAAGYAPPAHSVRALWVTRYKDMGQAHTVTAMEQLALPDWFDLRSARHARLWLLTLEEHDTIIRRLTDTHSDEYALINQYRRTFQMRKEESIREFVIFLRDYGALLFRRRTEDHWTLPQFTLNGVSPILGRSSYLGKTLRHPGFRAIAAAIRASTFGAQAERYGGRAQSREVRCGLLDELRRADTLGRPQLLSAVAEFISTFNAETRRRRAMGIPAMQIQDIELEAFHSHAENLPPQVPVGALLGGVSSCLPKTFTSAKTSEPAAQAVEA